MVYMWRLKKGISYEAWINPFVKSIDTKLELVREYSQSNSYTIPSVNFLFDLCEAKRDHRNWDRFTQSIYVVNQRYDICLLRGAQNKLGINTSMWGYSIDVFLHKLSPISFGVSKSVVYKSLQHELIVI